MKRQLIESTEVFGKTLISVDVQPEYATYMGFSMDSYSTFLNENYGDLRDLIFLYNGQETLDMITEHEYMEWLLSNGVEEQVVDGARFYDKGYAFFRYCMDSYLDKDVIANFIRFMYQNDIRDSRDMDRDAWTKYLRQYRRTDKREIYDLLKVSSDCVHIPDLMDFLKHYDNIALTGGGVNECLKEVEIALIALRKKYGAVNEFTY